MADVGDEEEYESDPEQAKLSLKMRRRREASDDEEEEDDDVGDARGGDRRTGPSVSDCESDGQGAPAEYDDEESELEEQEEDELLEEDEELRGRQGGTEAETVVAQVLGKNLDGDYVGAPIEGTSVREKRENEQNDRDEFYVHDNDGQLGDNANGSEGEKGQEEKKENEPFAVPTAGAFYMHDDRFRDSAGGRHRRTLGGRNLWESKDDKKWGHDKFEELTMHERHYNEGKRVSRGRNRARGRNRGEDRGYSQGNRPNMYNNNNQNNAPKSVRGRGPRRYQPSTVINNEASAQSRKPAKSVEKTSRASSERATAVASSSESAQVPARKNVVASSLNYASPPFYPSGSSNKEINVMQKRDAQISQSNNMRGKNVSDSLGMDKLYIDDSISTHAGKPLNNLLLPTSGPSFINSTQPSQSRVHGRGPTPSGQMAYQRVSVQTQFQPKLRPHSASGSRASSPPKASGPVNSLESTEVEYPLESYNSKTALVGKGKGSIQSSGMSSFPYAGAQVSGVSGGNHGDQNFPGAPAFLPVMQFAGHHPSGIGVPAVGMAFPGYVAQPNGMGNSEMTWLPVLAGAAGALGPSYPYITMDGAYHARPSGQMSSLTPPSSKDNNTNKPGTEVKPTQRPELANDELGQRQNKARRYTEMKFDQ